MDDVKQGNSVKSGIFPMDILKKILIFAVLVAGTSVMLRPLQLGLQNRMEKIRDNFFYQVEEQWGLKIKYGSMGPSVFGVLDLRDVLVLREDDSVLLSVSRLALSYSVLEFFRGNAVQAFHSVRIDRPVLSLDFEKDADFIGRINRYRNREILPEGRNGTDSDGVIPGNFIPDNFSLRILNGEWDISGGAGDFKLYGIRINAAVRESRVSFNGRWEAAASIRQTESLFSGPKNKNNTVMEASMRGRINGEYLADSDEGRATVQIPFFAGKNFRVRPLEMGIYLSQGHLEIRKTYDRMPVAIAVAYDSEQGSLKGGFEAENFSPADLLVFTNSLAEYNHWLAMKISGSAGFDLTESGTVAYNVDLKSLGNSADDFFFALKASGDSDRVGIDTLRAGSGNGELSFNGAINIMAGELIPVAPEGTLSLSNFSLHQSGAFHGDRGLNGNVAISTHGKMINLSGENISAGETALSSLDASVYQDDQGFSFIFTAKRSVESETDPERILSLEGSVDYDADKNLAKHIQASLLLDSFLVGDILAFVQPIAPSMNLPPPARGAADNLAITTEVFFTTDYEYLLYNAPSITFTYDGLANVIAAASFSGTDRNFELREGRISWADDGYVDISCFVDHSDTKDINFSLSAGYRDITYFFEGMILDQLNISVMGSYGFMVNLSTGTSGRFAGYTMGDLIPIPSGDNYAYLSFFSTFLYDSPSSWQVKLERLGMTGIKTPSSTASIHFTGSANEQGLTIPDILIEDGRGNLEGGISIEWDHAYRNYGFAANLIGNNPNEYYIVRGLYADKRLELDFSGQRMQLARISSYNALADATFSLLWDSPASFEAKAELSSLVLNMNGDRMIASASLNAGSEIMTVNNLFINYAGLEASVPIFEINRFASRAKTEAAIYGNIAGMPVDLSLRGEAFFNNTETWLDLLGSGDGFIDASVTVNTARYNTMEAEEPFSFFINAVRENKRPVLNVAGGPRNMLRLNYRPGLEDGDLFFVALSAPFPVRGSITGTINSGNIDAQTGDLYVDLGSLWRFIPPSADTVLFPGGIVTASVRITGPLDDPEFYGIAHAKSVQISVPEFLPEPVRPVPTTFWLNGSEMTFGPVDAGVGRGGGQGRGWFRWDQWVPSTFIIDIQVPNETPIPYNYDDSGLLAYGLASGTLNLAMEDWVFTVSGDLTAHNTEISLASTDFASFSGDNLFESSSSIVTTVVDLSIKSGRRVEFYWPSVDFPIIQANAAMGSGITIGVDAEAGNFSVTGDVRLRSGEIFYLERNFYIREGTLFFNENELSFDPRISARAEIRDQSEEGPVTIAMIIDNAPLMSFTPRFESNPPLSQFEIYSILGQNPQGDFDSGQRNVLVSSGLDFLAQSLVFRRFQRQVRDFLNVDMFSVRTTIFQNLLLPSSGNQYRGDIERPARFGNYFDNSTVFIGKYFAADIFGEALLSFRYDDAQETMGGLKVEPELALEMRNPLFDIRFNMALLHPENWFIDDISFSLIWRRSY